MTVGWEQIKRSLVDRGIWDENGLSRRTRARLCRKCGAPVMAGLDHDRAALSVYADPTPLNALGEAMALMDDRSTYSLRYIGGRYELDHRAHWTIAAAPAGTDPRVEVLAAHKCGSAFPDAYRGTALTPLHQSKGTDNDDPPF